MKHNIIGVFVVFLIYIQVVSKFCQISPGTADRVFELFRIFGQAMNNSRGTGSRQMPRQQPNFGLGADLSGIPQQLPYSQQLMGDGRVHGINNSYCSITPNSDDHVMVRTV